MICVALDSSLEANGGMLLVVAVLQCRWL